MEVKRKIRNVYSIHLERGLENVLLKVVENKELADYYEKKYSEKYPYYNINVSPIEFVEAT